MIRSIDGIIDLFEQALNRNPILFWKARETERTPLRIEFANRSVELRIREFSNTVLRDELAKFTREELVLLRDCITYGAEGSRKTSGDQSLA